MKQISLKTGTNKKYVAAHKRSMMEKLKVRDMAGLIRVLKMAEQYYEDYVTGIFMVTCVPAACPLLSVRS